MLARSGISTEYVSSQFYQVICNIIAGAQPFEVIWLHNDKEIKKNDPVYKMLSNGNVRSLIIQEVRIFT